MTDHDQLRAAVERLTPSPGQQRRTVRASDLRLILASATLSREDRVNVATVSAYECGVADGKRDAAATPTPPGDEDIEAAARLFTRSVYHHLGKGRMGIFPAWEEMYQRFKDKLYPLILKALQGASPAPVTVEQEAREIVEWAMDHAQAHEEMIPLEEAADAPGRYHRKEAARYRAIIAALSRQKPAADKDVPTAAAAAPHRSPPRKAVRSPGTTTR